MSHFTVLVTGNDVAEALAPFEEINGNDQSKWDWYQIGGRWSGQLKMKEGATSGQTGERSWANENEPIQDGYTDSALAGDVDWSAMVSENSGKYLEDYRTYRPIVQGQPLVSWDQLYEKVSKEEITIDDAREQFHGQPVFVAVKAKMGEVDSFFFDMHRFVSDLQAFDNEDDYVAYKGKSDACTYAILHEGQWLEPGEMGWFGVTSATSDSRRQFVEQFWQIVNSLSPDTRVTVVDCHI